MSLIARIEGPQEAKILTQHSVSDPIFIYSLLKPQYKSLESKICYNNSVPWNKATQFHLLCK